MRPRFKNSVQKAGSSTTCYNPRFRENRSKEPLTLSSSTASTSTRKSSNVKYVKVKFFDGSIEVSLREYMNHKTLVLCE